MITHENIKKARYRNRHTSLINTHRNTLTHSYTYTHILTHALLHCPSLLTAR